eukprot:Selendium_serpulae@DN5807_c0_g1_i2.p1
MEQSKLRKKKTRQRQTDGAATEQQGRSSDSKRRENLELRKNGPQATEATASPIDGTVDERFNVRRDPRFKRIPEKEKKVQLDSRFDRILNDEKFSTHLTTDPFSGRRKRVKNDKLKSIYEASAEKQEEPVPDETATKSEEEDVGAGGFQWEAESTSASESDSDASLEEDDDVWKEADQSIEHSAATSSRLAVMHCDWDNVEAADIYTLLQSYLKSGGRKKAGAENIVLTDSTPSEYGKVKRVAVYPSEFGLERLEEERVKGPRLNFRGDSAAGGDDTVGDDVGVDEQENDVGVGQENDPKTSKAIRRYQRDRSRYYFAIAECDKPSTAQFLYDQLDGLDSDVSIGALDLRFVPDDLEIPHKSVTECTAIPEQYQAVTGTHNALRHCQPDCMWDKTDRKRTKALKLQKFTDAELETLDMEAFLGSDDSDTNNNGKMGKKEKEDDDEDDDDDD